MLLSLVIMMRPEKQGTIPANQGRALEAEFLKWVGKQDTTRAKNLHDGDSLQPFTVSDLQGCRPNGGFISLAPKQPLWWRITTLDPELSELIEQRLLPEFPSGMSLRKDRCSFSIEKASLDPKEHPWADRTTYNELISRHLLNKEMPDPSIHIEFNSPTTFHTGESHLPLPVPDKLLGSWVERWNSFSPVGLTQEVRPFAQDILALSRHELSTQVVHFGKRTIIGFTGWCIFRILSKDPYWLRLVHTLANYSFYCGTGVKTSCGMGQTRLRIAGRRL